MVGPCVMMCNYSIFGTNISTALNFLFHPCESFAKAYAPFVRSIDDGI